MPYDDNAVQKPNEIVFIGSWASDEDFSIHPKGSQPKSTVVCPDPAPFDFLIPGHQYIFKTSKKKWQEIQLWSEVISYRISKIAGINAPPCHVAVNENTGEVGVLMEFFFGYPLEAEPQRFIHASEYLARLLSDRKRGRPHELRTNLRFCRALKLPDPEIWWAQILAFDALIGNTDRHPENWGFLVNQCTDGTQSFRFAPAFDNGTSLGYEQSEDKLGALCENASLSRYVSRGTHHCGWNASEDGPLPHMSLCAKYISAYPRTSAEMRNVIRFERGQITAICDECAEFDVGVRFTPARARFVAALVEARRAALAEILGGYNGELD
ncbi:HipA domain-containing protein [Niveispirillum sp.]|uniref:HipA domain-containing protein n=1 Tax=Niveispirillum sp. TaxID=1917217 RepID=UPI001B5ECCBA|nr:HipA domain-containing protein [Niveispirillum sp.]MBP7334930.1 HipA domain-containing protein [Niveispirillum sp.]